MILVELRVIVQRNANEDHKEAGWGDTAVLLVYLAAYEMYLRDSGALHSAF